MKEKASNRLLHLTHLLRSCDIAGTGQQGGTTHRMSTRSRNRLSALAYNLSDSTWMTLGKHDKVDAFDTLEGAINHLRGGSNESTVRRVSSSPLS